MIIRVTAIPHEAYRFEVELSEGARAKARELVTATQNPESKPLADDAILALLIKNMLTESKGTDHG